MVSAFIAQAFGKFKFWSFTREDFKSEKSEDACKRYLLYILYSGGPEDYALDSGDWTDTNIINQSS